MPLKCTSISSARTARQPSEDNVAVALMVPHNTRSSYLKLGDYKFSQVWYERALKPDPNHVLTSQHYGLWHIEHGNRDQAQENAVRPGIAAGPYFFL
jgi:hypothetical protein